MMKQENSQLIYATAVLDLITVSTEFCKLLENHQEVEKEAFIDSLCKLLPMIYLKAILLPEMEEASGYNQDYVTEEDYNYILHTVADKFGEDDTYLETFKEDFKYSEHPLLCTISEGIADVYQSLRNLVEIYRQGFDDAMEVALYECAEQFKMYWGQTLLNVLRAIHSVRYADEQP